MKQLEKYTDGLDMEQFKHIPEISWYNHNYYVGFNQELLYGKSDDDRTTEWWLIHGNFSYFLGESDIEDEALHRLEKRNT